MPIVTMSHVVTTRDHHIHSFPFSLFACLSNASHGLSNLTFPVRRPLEPVARGLKVHHGLVHGLFARGDERAVLHHGLVEGLAGDQDEPRGLGGPLLDVGGDDVSGLLEHDVVVRRDGLADLFGAVSKRHGALQRVREGVPSRREFLGDGPARSDRHVEEPHGRVREVLERLDALAAAGDDFDLDLAVVGLCDGDLGGPEIAVPRFARLEVLGEVDPELHANVDIFGLYGHFGVHDAAAGCHLCGGELLVFSLSLWKVGWIWYGYGTYKLKVAWTDCAFVPREIFMVDSAFEKVRDGLLATVGVVGKACAGRNAEVVEHEKRGEVAQLWCADAASHHGARALGLLAGEERELNGSWSGHVCCGCGCGPRRDQR